MSEARAIPAKPSIPAWVWLCLSVALLCTAAAWATHKLIVERRVERRFGCEFDTPYVGRAGCSLEVRSIAGVDAEGAFARAGVRPGEFVTPYSVPRPADLLERLDDLAPGESLAVPLRMPQQDGCWQDWPERTVTIVAP